ncbi:MAG: serine/threonine-protein phosphatase [Candidatus Aminicenantes bacterium]|nr:serine/threonine-protein phosphatase [Candidatus Aminicenantes bacterium]
MKIGKYTDKGLRQQNEDSFFYFPLPSVNIVECIIGVADGMGGLQEGGSASNFVSDIFNQDLINCLSGIPESTERKEHGDLVKAGLEAAFRKADACLRELEGKNVKMTKRGSTLTVAVIYEDGNVIIGHAGDCSAYHLNGQNIKKITRDHAVHKRLTNRLGGRRFFVDLQEIRLRKGDALLLCTDGVTDVMNEEAIHREILGGSNIQEGVTSCVEKALSLGTTDNSTVIAYEFGELLRMPRESQKSEMEDTQELNLKKRRGGGEMPFWRKAALALAVVFFIVTAGLLAYYFFFMEKGSSPGSPFYNSGQGESGKAASVEELYIEGVAVKGNRSFLEWKKPLLRETIDQKPPLSYEIFVFNEEGGDQAGSFKVNQDIVPETTNAFVSDLRIRIDQTSIPLEENRLYSWKVRGLNRYGEKTWESEEQKFAYSDVNDPIRPPKPLTTKIDLKAPDPQKLAWEKSMDPDPDQKVIAYDVFWELGKTRRQKQVEESQTLEVPADIAAKTSSGRYRVRAVNNKGDVSQWSDFQTFSVLGGEEPPFEEKPGMPDYTKDALRLTAGRDKPLLLSRYFENPVYTRENAVLKFSFQNERKEAFIKTLRPTKNWLLELGIKKKGRIAAEPRQLSRRIGEISFDLSLLHDGPSVYEIQFALQTSSESGRNENTYSLKPQLLYYLDAIDLVGPGEGEVKKPDEEIVFAWKAYAWEDGEWAERYWIKVARNPESFGKDKENLPDYFFLKEGTEETKFDFKTYAARVLPEGVKALFVEGHGRWYWRISTWVKIKSRKHWVHSQVRTVFLEK